FGRLNADRLPAPLQAPSPRGPRVPLSCRLVTNILWPLDHFATSSPIASGRSAPPPARALSTGGASGGVPDARSAAALGSCPPDRSNGAALPGVHRYPTPTLNNSATI